MPQPLYAPFDSFGRLTRLEARIVDSEELDGFDVSPVALVDGDNVEDAVVAHAVHGHSKAYSHDERRQETTEGGGGRRRHLEAQQQTESGVASRSCEQAPEAESPQLSGP